MSTIENEELSESENVSFVCVVVVYHKVLVYQFENKSKSSFFFFFAYFCIFCISDFAHSLYYIFCVGESGFLQLLLPSGW